MAPKSNLIKLGLLTSVVDKALSFNTAILVFVVTTLVGSAPIDKEMDAVVDVYTGSSNTEVRVFWGGADEVIFGARLSFTVVNFVGSKLMDNFTKET